MLSSKKYIFKSDKANKTILQHMGYSDVLKKYATKLKRKQRRIYVSNNIDCVGAYNILCLYLQEMNRSFPEFKSLSSPMKVSV